MPTCPEKTDEELVALTLENQDYYWHIMKRYEEKLKRYIVRVSGASPEDTEDLLQDIFIKIYRNLNNFDLDLKFSSWIYRIAHNQVVSNFRKNKNYSTRSLDDEKIFTKLAHDLDLEQEVDLKYAKNNIMNILNNLEEKYREVLVLKFLEEKNYKEISDILKKPLGTIASLINRSKENFKKEAALQQVKF